MSVASPLSLSEAQSPVNTEGETQVRIPFGAVPAGGGSLGTISPVSDLISNFSVSPAEQAFVVAFILNHLSASECLFLCCGLRNHETVAFQNMFFM